MSRYPANQQMSPLMVIFLTIVWIVILVPISMFSAVQTITLKISGLEAQGIVVDTKGSGKNRFNVIVFEIDGQPITFSSSAANDIGETVEVVYLAKNPKATAKVNSLSLIIHPLLFGMVASTMPIFLIDSWNNRKRKTR